MSGKRKRLLAELDQLDAEVGQRLRDAQANVEAALQALADAKEMRAGVINEAIEEAHWSHARIGAELGVSKQRVAQLRRADAQNGGNNDA